MALTRTSTLKPPLWYGMFKTSSLLTPNCWKAKFELNAKHSWETALPAAFGSVSKLWVFPRGRLAVLSLGYDVCLLLHARIKREEKVSGNPLSNKPSTCYELERGSWRQTDKAHNYSMWFSIPTVNLMYIGSVVVCVCLLIPAHMRNL